MKSFLTKIVMFSRLVVLQFRADQCLNSAASLSYTFLLALVPVLVVAFSVLGAFPTFGGVEGKLQSLLLDTFVPSAGKTLEVYLNQFIDNAGKSTLIGSLAFFVTSVMLFATIQSSFDQIFLFTAKRPFLNNMMLFWTMITLGPLLLGASLVLSTEFFGFLGWSELTVLWASLLPFILEFFAFFILYSLIPNTKINLFHAWVGSVVAALIFHLFKYLFSLYILYFPSYQAIYGALATIPIFLTWVYLSWSVVLLGAEITACLDDWYSIEKAIRRDKYAQAANIFEGVLRSLECLYKKNLQGKTASWGELILFCRVPARFLNSSLGYLMEKEIVTQDRNGCFLLKKNPKSISIRNLYDILDLDRGLGGSSSLENLVGMQWEEWMSKVEILSLGRAMENGSESSLQGEVL